MSRPIAEVVEEHLAANKTELPVFDGTSKKLQDMLESGEFDVSEVEQLIGTDPVLSSAVLRMANSTFYAGLDKVASVSDGIMRLGMKQIVSLATLVTQKESYQLRDAALQPLVKSLWSHAVACAAGSQWLAGKLKRGDLATEAFMAGMLHDIGKLLVLRVVDDVKSEDPDFDPPEALVREVMRSMHTSQGAALMEQWNMPPEYVRIVREHHSDVLADNDALGALVRLVDQACNKLGLGVEPTPELRLAATAEAQLLRIGDVETAELEIKLEDAMELAEGV